MKKALLRTGAVVMFLISATSLGVYIFLSLSPSTVLSPSGRLVLLGVTCVFSYVAGVLYSCTLSAEGEKVLMKSLFLVYFILYVVLLVTLVLFDSYFGRTGVTRLYSISPEEREAYIQNSLNLIPFESIWCFAVGLVEGTVTLRTVIINIAGNLTAFMPFAFFIPMFFNGCKKLLNFLIVVSLIVIAVEVAQLILCTGCCDIDDLILNVGGACIAHAVLRLSPIQSITKKITRIN